MITINDAAKLALTKLKKHKFRTLLILFSSSLMFAIIFAVIIMFRGTLNSVIKFNTNSLSNRYLVSVNYASEASSITEPYPDSILIRAKELYNNAVNNKKSEANKIGISYDPLTEQKPTPTGLDGKEHLDMTSIYAAEAYNEYVSSHSSSKEELLKLLEKYNYENIYYIKTSPVYSGQLNTMSNGEEDFSIELASSSSSDQTNLSSGWKYMDQSIVKSFLLSDEQIKQQQNNNYIPIIAPFSKIEKALGLAALPSSSSPKDRMNRIDYVKKNAGSVTFSICYRNDISQSQINNAIEYENNKNNDKYIKPSIVYGLPNANSCDQAIVLSDTRTEQKKIESNKQKLFDSIFGQETAPTQNKLIFQVVGISPDVQNHNSSGAANLLYSLVGSTLNGQWVVPQQMFDSTAAKSMLSNIFSESKRPLGYVKSDIVNAIVELKSSQKTEEMMNDFACANSACNDNISLSFFGNNSVLINNILKQALDILSIIGIILLVIASSILISVTSKVIDGCRKETAVFRALGAKKADIRLIYFIYSIALLSSIILFSLLIGIVITLAIQAVLSPNLSIQLHLIYIFSDSNLNLSLFGIWWQALLVVIVIIYTLGLFGTFVSLQLNLSRNITKDMRDDT